MEGRRGKCQTRTIVWRADGAGPNGLRKARSAQFYALGRHRSGTKWGKVARSAYREFALVLETGYFKTMRPLATTAGVSPPSYLAFFEQEWNGSKCGDGIKPCNMEDGVER